MKEINLGRVLIENRHRLGVTQEDVYKRQLMTSFAERPAEIKMQSEKY